MNVERMCVVCRNLVPREKLFRIAKTADGFCIDFENKIISRGAYICKDKNCVLSARKKSAFERSFSSKIDSKIYDTLEDLVNDDK